MPPKTKAAGDMTGRKRDALSREHAQEIVERQKEVSLVNSAKEIVDDRAVFDPSTGGVVEGPELADAVQEAAGQIQYAEEDDEVVDATDQVVHGLDDPVPPHNGSPTHVEGGFRIIRINTDLEDVTIGQGTSYNFLEGRRYKVPVHVADHLEEKGYVWH